jgi:hypothetical protein
MGKRSNKTKRQPSGSTKFSDKAQVTSIAITRTGKILARCGLFLCALIAVAFSIKTLYEADIWWMLRTGRWIVDNGYVPQQDVFSYTFSGAEWINVKWLYEVLIYGLQQVGGAPFILILQMAISVTIVILWCSLTDFGTVTIKMASRFLHLVSSLLYCSAFRLWNSA